MDTMEKDRKIAERLETQETRSRTLVALALVSWVALAVIFLSGQKRYGGETIVAREILLKDAHGVVRVEMKADGQAPGVVINGSTPSHGFTSLSRLGLFSINQDGHSVSLTTERLLMMDGLEQKALFNGNTLTIGGSEDHPVLSLSAEQGSGSIEVADSSGYSSVLGKANLEDTKTGASETTSAASLILFNKSHRIVWQAP